MKPIVTWIVLANARSARVLANSGPGKGLSAVGDQHWQAPEAGTPNDRAGVGHSSAGPGISAVEQTDRQAMNDAEFARDVANHLSTALAAKRFDRLVLVAGPHMLGLLRAHLNESVRASVLGEIPKDLSAQSLSNLETHLGELIAV